MLLGKGCGKWLGIGLAAWGWLHGADCMGLSLRKLVVLKYHIGGVVMKRRWGRGMTSVTLKGRGLPFFLRLCFSIAFKILCRCP